MRRHLLSKSTFLRGCQCPKSLYLYNYKPRLRDRLSDQQKALFKRGTDIGRLARQLFPGGVDLTPPTPAKYRQAVMHTATLLRQQQPVIYEAAFQFNEVLAAMDVLVAKNGRWQAYEVKSATRVTATHLLDAALQYYAMQGFGVEVETINLVVINSDYVRQGPVEVKKLFKVQEVTAEVLERQEPIGRKVKDFKQVLKQKQTPQISIGRHCYQPYPCDFIGHCWRNVPGHSVFDMPGLDRDRQFALLEKGIVSIADFEQQPDCNDQHREIAACINTGKPFVQRDKLGAFFEKLQWPLHFLDFNAYRSAVPPFDNTRPYQSLPFQWALLRQESPQAPPQPLKFLAQGGTDPRPEFLKSLLSGIGPEGSVLIFNENNELRNLEQLAATFPEHQKALTGLLQRAVDLSRPFTSHHYYEPAMKGDYALATVHHAQNGVWQQPFPDKSTAAFYFEGLPRQMDLFQQQTDRQLLNDFMLQRVKMMEAVFNRLRTV